MDARAYLHSIIFDTLTTDAELIRLCGGEVRLFLETADPGVKFPYGVQAIQEDAAMPASLMMTARLYLEWYVKDALKTRLSAITARVRALLDRAVLSLADDPAGCARAFYETGSALDGVEEHVWGELMEFSLRYTCTDHLQAVLARAEG